MRFSSIAVLAVVAPVATGFAPFQRQSTTPRTILRKVEYDLDLGFDDVAPKKKGGKTAAPAPAPIPEPVPEPPAPKSRKRATKKVEAPPAPAPVPEPAPAPKTRAKAKKVKPEPVKVAPPPAPTPVVKSAPPKSTSSASAGTKAGGVALGVAPLVLAPVALLSAGRSVLTGTVARREKIQKEIAEFEKAKQKKQLQAEVDGGELTKALVRKNYPSGHAQSFSWSECF